MRTHRLNDLLSVTIRYTYTRNGYFYYQRAVPDDLVDRYGKKTVKRALKTTSPETALRLVTRLNATLEAEWDKLRLDPQSYPSSLKAQAKELLRDSASATLNKWIRTTGAQSPNHAFRHTMNDRLRDVGCPEDVRDQIGGWSRPDMASKYGVGYSLERMHEHLLKTVLPSIAPEV